MNISNKNPGPARAGPQRVGPHHSPPFSTSTRAGVFAADEIDKLRAKAIGSMEQLVGRAITVSMIATMDKYESQIRGSKIRIDGREIPTWEMIDLAIGSAIEAKPNIFSVRVAMKYVASTIDRCKANNCLPGQWPGQKSRALTADEMRAKGLM